MATKNFKAMSTKKLNALLTSGNLSEEETLAVQNELNERANATAAATSADTLSDEEHAALSAAEASAAQSGVAEAKAKVTADTVKASSKKKMTDEERDALAIKLRQDVLHHRCDVVPFNSIEWVQGTVVGVIVNKKMNTVSLAIKTDDGSRIVKAHDSKLIKILEEKVEVVRNYVGGGRKTKLDENGNPIEDTPWTADEVEKGVLELGKNVGKMVLFDLRSAGFGAKVDEAGNELENMVTGRIISIVPNKRNKTFLYAIQYVVDGVTKTAHKVSTLETLKISEDEMDEVGKQLNEKFIARRTGGGGRGVNNHETKLEQMKKELSAVAYAEYVSKLVANAENRLANVKAALESLNAELAAAREAAEQTEPNVNNGSEDLM